MRFVRLNKPYQLFMKIEMVIVLIQFTILWVASNIFGWDGSRHNGIISKWTIYFYSA